MCLMTVNRTQVQWFESFVITGEMGALSPFLRDRSVSELFPWGELGPPFLLPVASLQVPGTIWIPAPGLTCHLTCPPVVSASWPIRSMATSLVLQITWELLSANDVSIFSLSFHNSLKRVRGVSSLQQFEHRNENRRHSPSGCLLRPHCPGLPCLRGTMEGLGGWEGTLSNAFICACWCLSAHSRLSSVERL